MFGKDVIFRKTVMNILTEESVITIQSFVEHSGLYVDHVIEVDNNLFEC